MTKTAGDYLCERLIEWGVDTIYGFPGDGLNGILGALGRHEDQLRFIQTRHEEMASFMACGHAKFTDEVGVCLATSGPGAIHLLNGADSTGQRKNLGELLRWCHESKRFAWTTVQAIGDTSELFGAVEREVGSLRHVLAQKTIGVLVRPSLPGLTGQSGPIRVRLLP